MRHTQFSEQVNKQSREREKKCVHVLFYKLRPYEAQAQQQTSQLSINANDYKWRLVEIVAIRLDASSVAFPFRPFLFGYTETGFGVAVVVVAAGVLVVLFLFSHRMQSTACAYAHSHRDTSK